MEKVSHFKKEIIFACLSSAMICGAIFGIFTFSDNHQPLSVTEIRSEKSQHLNNPLGHPDKFAEYFNVAIGADQGYTPYPQGYQMRQHQDALLKNAKRGRASVDLAWVERGPGNVGGRSRAVVHDPADPTFNTWFVASVGGGVWRGQRSINTFGLDNIEWTSLTDDLPSLAATTLAMSTNNPDVMYVGTGEGFFNVGAASGSGIFRTNDQGISWTQVPGSVNPQTNDWNYVNRLIVHPDNPDIVVAVTNTGIFRTENGGQSFNKVYSSAAKVQDLKVNPRNFNIQFAAVNETSILRSTDGGKSWQISLNSFRYPPDRIELAISPSNPDVIWASAYGNGSRKFEFFIFSETISDFYRSLDGGLTWRRIEFSDNSRGFDTAFLGNQGWYNNSIAVHPFSPDSVFIGGVLLHQASIDKGQDVQMGVFGQITNYPFRNFPDFIQLQRFDASSAGGSIEFGYLDDNEANDVQDVTLEDMVSIEVRFGSGLSQKGHRFTVPPNGGSSGDGGSGIPYSQYVYEDYIDLPFQVWDTDNNRQLMVSFRDQARDGQWTLAPSNTTGSGITHSREYIFISKYDYDASNPNPDLATIAGLRKGLLYFFWPVLDATGQTWDPISPPSGTIDLDFGIGTESVEIADIALWDDANDGVHVDHHALITLPDEGRNFHILNTNDGGFAFSQDSGRKWKEGDASTGMNTSQFYDATKQPGIQRYIGGTQDNSTWLSEINPDKDDLWKKHLNGDGFDVIWTIGDSLMGTSQFNVISRSLDGGVEWTNVSPNAWRGQFLTTLGWTPESGQTVFTFSPEAGALRSSDFGESWHPLYPDWAPISRSHSKLRLSLADPSIVWFGNWLKSPGEPGNLHVSEGALNSISEVKTREVTIPEGAPTTTITGVATHPLSLQTAYIMYSVWCQPKLYRTENLGQSWEQLSGFPEDRPVNSTAPCLGSKNGFPNTKVYDLEVFPDIPWLMWVATDIGIYESRDHGETWAYSDNGLPAVSVWRIKIIDDEVVLATHGRGIWTLPIDQVQTHAEQEVLEIPDSFELYGNYPNPFNPTTTISFNVENDSHIRLIVFDMLGRKVAILADQPFKNGRYELQWNASNVSSGQYIYRMEVDGKVIGAKPMVLVK